MSLGLTQRAGKSASLIGDLDEFLAGETKEAKMLRTKRRKKGEIKDVE
jgi:hypothetical protein